MKFVMHPGSAWGPLKHARILLLILLFMIGLGGARLALAQDATYPITFSSDTGTVQAYFTENGDLILNGELTTVSPITQTPEINTAWTVKNDLGEIVALLKIVVKNTDGSHQLYGEGDLLIKGKLYANTPPPVNCLWSAKNSDGTVISGITSTGDLYLLGSLIKRAAFSTLLDEAAYYSMGKRTSSQVSFSTWLQSIVSKESDINEDTTAATLVTNLAFAYQVLADKGLLTDTDRIEFWRTLDFFMNKIYTAWAGSGRTWGNKEIRMICAFTIAGMILDKITMPEFVEMRNNGTAKKNSGLTAIRQVFSNTNTDWHRNFATDGVYDEGSGYAAFMLEGLAPFLYFYQRSDYANTDFLEDSSANPQLANFFWWIAKTQRPDGYWFAQNDSGVASFQTLPIVYHVLNKPAYQTGATPNVGLQRAIHCAYANQPVGNDGIPIFEWGMPLQQALFQVPPFTGSLPTQLDKETQLFSNGGQLYVGSKPSAKTKDQRIQAMFLNEGGWVSIATQFNYMPGPNYKNEFYQNMATKFGITLNDNKSGMRPKEYHKRANDTHFEIFAYGKSLLTGPGDIGYADTEENFKNVVKFTSTGDYRKIFIGSTYNQYPVLNYIGSTLSAIKDAGGASVTGYYQDSPGSWTAVNPVDITEGRYVKPTSQLYGFDENTSFLTPYNSFVQPEQHNMLQVRAEGEANYRSPITKLVSTSKIINFTPPASHNYATLHKLATDTTYQQTYDRYVLASRQRYFIIFDQVNLSTPQILQMTLHGRGTACLQPHDQVGTPDLSYQKAYWTYEKKKMTASGLTTVDQDPNIRLYAYFGNPAVRVNTTYTSFSRLENGGRDRGDDPVDLMPYQHNYFFSDLIRYATRISDPAKPQNGMVTLLWPQNRTLSTEEPNVTWSCDWSNNTITNIKVEVSYYQEGLSFTDRWQFPMNSTDITEFDQIIWP